MLSLLSSLLSKWASTALMEALSLVRLSLRAMIEVLSSWRMTGETSTLTLWPMIWASSFCHSVLPALALPPAGADPPAVAEGPVDEAVPPSPFDVPGRSQPASTGSPTPTRVERVTKDRRDVIRGEVPSERENAEDTGTSFNEAVGISQRQSVICAVISPAMGTPWVLPIAPRVLPTAARGVHGHPGVPTETRVLHVFSPWESPHFSNDGCCIEFQYSSGRRGLIENNGGLS